MTVLNSIKDLLPSNSTSPTPAKGVVALSSSPRSSTLDFPLHLPRSRPARRLSLPRILSECCYVLELLTAPSQYVHFPSRLPSRTKAHESARSVVILQRRRELQS